MPLRYNYDKPEKPRISRVFGYLARFFILFQTEKSSREVVIMSLLSQTTEETLLGLINPGTCFGCEAGTVIAHIRANGDLFPCSFFMDPIFCAGNILQNSLQSIWATSEAFYPLRKITNIPEKCKDCKKTIAVSEDAERMHTIQPVVCRMQILDVGGSNVY